MAASPHSQETVSRLFERNYVPVLWHLMRKCTDEIEFGVCLSGLNFGIFVKVLRLGAVQHLYLRSSGVLYDLCTGITERL